MTEFIMYFAIALMCSMGLCLIAFYSNSRIGYLFMALWLMLLLASILTIAAIRGQPKSTTTEIRSVAVAEVLWVKIVPNQNIYLILTWKGLKEPLYYVMPWDANTGKEIAEAQVKATSRNVPLMLRNPFGKNGRPGKGRGEGGGNNTSGDGVGNTGSGDTDEGESFYPKPPSPSPVKPTYDMQDAGI